MSPAMRIFFLRVFPFIFVVIGAFFVYFGAKDIGDAKQSVYWPSEMGKIISSSVDTSRSSSGRGSSSTSYHAAILYEFTVDGITYNGNRVAYGDFGSSNSSHARRIVNRYPEGKEVKVYYSIDNPEKCVLEPGLKGQAYVFPGIGLAFMAAGLFMAFYLPKKLG